MSLQSDLLTKMISEIADYAVLFIDIDGTIKTWNTGAERIKGYKSEEIIGKNFRCFYTEKDRTSGKPDRLIEMAKSEGRAQDEGWRVRKDGSKFWGSVVITCVHDDSGNLTGFSKVTRDLTVRRKNELALKKQSIEIQNKNREMEQFVYVASHDLQEPLRTVKSLSHLLSTYRDLLDEDGRHTINYMNEAVSRMQQLVRGLLDYSRIGLESSLKKLDLNELVANVIDDLKVGINSSNAHISVSELPSILGYELELRALFQNLISNAIKFRRSNCEPQIKIGYQREKKAEKFWIRDNGIGIPKEHLDRIFSIFQRLHPKSEYEGAGIGLAHCIKIIELHEGEIWVESTVNEGSVFYFTLKRNLKERGND